MELKQYWDIIRKRLFLIILITLACSLVSAVYSYFVIKPTYKANISVIIGKDTGSTTSENSSTSYNDLMLYQKSVKTYSILATSRKVAEDVISKLNLNMGANTLINSISAVPSADTEFLTLTVSSKDAKQAADIANQLVKSLKSVSAEIKKQDAVQLVDDAEIPAAPSSPRPMLNIAIAFFLGLMVSFGICFLLEYMDSTVKSQEELEKLLGLPVIGSIPFSKAN